MALYKKTLIVCSVIFLCCVVLSVLLLIPRIPQIEAFIFIRDYMVGIACSIIVVLVTTYMQFRFEQRKSLASTLSSLRFFFFDYLLIVMCLDPKENVSEKLWEYYDKKIEQHIKEITDDLLDIEWFSKKKKEIAVDIQKHFLKLRIDLSKFHISDNEERVKSIIGVPVIKAIKDSTLLLASSDDYTYIREEIIKDYEKAENCLSEYDNWKK